MNDQSGPVMQVFEVYSDAVHTRDVDAVLAIYDEDAHVIDLWAQWEDIGAEARHGMVTE